MRAASSLAPLGGTPYEVRLDRPDETDVPPERPAELEDTGGRLLVASRWPARYEHGRLVRTLFAGDPARLTLPDGTGTITASWPTGELLAAHVASGAPFVVAASSKMPTARAVRAVLPLATALLSVAPMRDPIKRRVSEVKIAPREYSWVHAHVQWADGNVREGWLRTGDASTFAVAVAAVVPARLAHGGVSPGAYTPAAALGPELAVDAGDHFILN